MHGYPTVYKTAATVHGLGAVKMHTLKFVILKQNYGMFNSKPANGRWMV